jgi:hypothetical protein
MKIPKTAISWAGAFITIVAATMLQPSRALAYHNDASYEAYARYSRAVGDWWYYHPGLFSTHTLWAPRHRIRYHLRAAATRWR